jgi:hypothetical protein
MDVARQAFVRALALDKWRELEDLRDTLGLDLAAAVREAERFPARGSYEPLWARQWQQHLAPEEAGPDAGRLFAAIERAVAAAVDDEEAERRRRGAPPLDEDPEYKAFVDRTLETLLRQAAEPGTGP